MISIDMGLIESLHKLRLNVSDYCNEKLWDYVTEMENKEKVVSEKTEDIREEIDKLNKKKLQMEKGVLLKAEMDKAGITSAKIKFLKSMNTNIMVAKDMKFGWERKFDEKLNWDELKALKEKWA